MSLLNILLLGCQFAGLFLFNIDYAPKDVQVTHDLPTSSIIGSEHWVYVDIDKRKLQGFAKYQIDVPEGIQIEPGDLRGASFTFSDGAAKIIWMSMPADEEFQVSYKMTIFEDCQVGNVEINQRFAYLEKNERKVLTLDPHIMYVEGENVSNEYVPDTLANGNRLITQLNPDHFLVEIDLYKDGIKGFAKIEEFIPEGMNAEAVTKSNAVFTQIDNKVKFVWFSIPEQDSLKIVYELFASSPSTTLPEINGEFTYLRNNQSKSIVMGTQEGNSSDILVMSPENTDAPDPVDLMDSVPTSEELAGTTEVLEVETLTTPDVDVPDVIEIVENTVDTNTESIDNTTETLTDATDNLGDTGTEAIDGATESVTNIADNVSDTATESIDSATENADEAVDNTSESIDNTGENLTDNTDEAIDTTTEAITGMTDNTSESITETITPDQPIDLSTPDTDTASISTDDNGNANDTGTDQTSNTTTADNSTSSSSDTEIDNFQDISNIPSPDKGVTYRVQIAAGKNVVDNVYFKKRHNFTEVFSIENHQSWVKYTTGSYAIYKEARDKREKVNSNYNFDGPFVTAYNEGIRITVQEALMITRQTWYQ